MRKRKIDAIIAATNSGRIIVNIEKGTVYSKKTKNLMGCLDKYGYQMTVLYHNGKNINVLIHQIIAIHAGLIIPDGYTINHKDGNKLNNRIDNLEVMTFRDNTLHAKRTGLHHSFIGIKNPKNKLSQEAVKLIRLFCDNGARYIDIARQFNVTSENISQIARRKTWQTI